MVPSDLRSGVSFAVDSRSQYFDSTQPTDLEDLLNNYIVNADQLRESHRAMQFLVEKRITKYNAQPLMSELMRKKLSSEGNILIVDQSYGDKSLIYGGVTDEIYGQMVDDALSSNPGSSIYFKIHPDSIQKNERSGFLRFLKSKRIEIIDWMVNPVDLILYMDKIYVATSQLGFEALLCGKDVFCYGLPFYAGWGLTKDFKNVREETEC